jgi:hypothetical protein
MSDELSSGDQARGAPDPHPEGGRFPRAVPARRPRCSPCLLCLSRRRASVAGATERTLDAHSLAGSSPAGRRVQGLRYTRPCCACSTVRHSTMIRHRLGTLLLLACGLATAPFGSMEQGASSRCHVVSGVQAATRSSPNVSSVRLTWSDDGADRTVADLAPPAAGAPPSASMPGVRRDGAGAPARDRRHGPGPRLTYYATAPPAPCSI